MHVNTGTKHRLISNPHPMMPDAEPGPTPHEISGGPDAGNDEPADVPPITKPSFLERARFFLVVSGGIYLAAVCLLAIPFFQSQTLYLNSLKFPFFANFNVPEKYGLAPNRTLNLKIQTPDNETLGAWFILSDPYYQKLPTIPQSLEGHILPAVQSHPTILFFHGNAATRAFHARIQHYQGFSTRLAANVLAIDYRGFADSSGSPSEAGLVRDARAAWDWLVQHGTKESDILIIGHSLGTGVTSQLAAQLADEGIQSRGIVLLSPFTSIREVLNTYHILGLVPLMKPLAMIPYATNLVSWALIHKFDSLKAVPKIKDSVLIAHAENDWDIPYSHSQVLFNAFLEPVLPDVEVPDNAFSITKAQWSAILDQQAARASKRNTIVISQHLRNFGTTEEFEHDGRKVKLVQTLAGGHDYLGVQEGVLDAIGQFYKLL
ncbi:Alpha/Beta hydrolase protein [Infundibulicybe gibba]|nr:Alpha/Beta hydrolase protein [Infundibulicybe gibba]